MDHTAKNPVEEAVVSTVYHNEIIAMCEEGLTEPVTFTFSTFEALQDFLSEYLEKKLFKKSRSDLVTSKVGDNPVGMNLGATLFACAVASERGAITE